MREVLSIAERLGVGLDLTQCVENVSYADCSHDAWLLESFYSLICFWRLFLRC